MNELMSTRTLDQIAAEINAHTGAMLISAMRIGGLMTEAKAKLQHGEFGSWLQENTAFSVSTANNYMRLFAEYSKGQGSMFGPEMNSQTFGNLTPSKALALLAVPEEDREKFAIEHEAASKSVRELKEEIKNAQAEREKAEQRAAKAQEDAEQAAETAKKNLDDANAATRMAESKLKQAEDDLAAARAQLATTPTTVEVVEDKEATAAAVRKEQEKGAKKLAKLEAAVRKAEEEAEQARKTAEVYKSRAIKAEEAAKSGDTAEIEVLKKQLEMADPIIAEFKGVFDTVAAAITKICELYKRAPEEKKRNLANAMDALADQLDKAITGGK